MTGTGAPELHERIGWSRAEDPEMFDEILAIFVRESGERLARMRAAVDNADFAQVEQISHALRGSCSALGADKLARLCAELEKTAGESSAIKAKALLADSENEFNRVKSVLRNDE